METLCKSNKILQGRLNTALRKKNGSTHLKLLNSNP